MKARFVRYFLPMGVLACVVAGVLMGLSGCSGGTVHVIDGTDTPIAGAEVKCIAPSYDLGTVKTDSQGMAKIPWSL